MHTKPQDERMEIIFQANKNEKKVDLAIFILDKTDFKPERVIRHKESHYIMIKVSLHQGDIANINVCTPNTQAPKYIKQLIIDLKGEIYNNTIIVENFNTPLSAIDRLS